jgi:glycosyltransferase 2 family protein
VALALIARRWEIARDIALSAAGTAAVSGILVAVLPVAGGIGVVEAGMILGLTAAGVSEADATAAVFIQRLFSSDLPPIWGWATLVWMRKREYL